MALYESLSGRVVIITGGGGGFGRVMALALLDRGARLMLTGARSPRSLDEMLALAEQIAPGACRGMLADVADAAACASVIAATRDAFGQVDVLINNAARASYEAAPVRGAPFTFWESDADGGRRIVETNLLGPFQMARAAAPLMVDRGFGKIINVSTSRITMVLGGSPYGPCKAALEAATVAWAKDLEGSGVTANVLLPGGASDTALIWGTAGARAIPGFQAGKGALGQEGNVQGGLLPPQIMGPPALWLCADESNGFNGRRLVARDWDPDLPPNQAAARALQPVGGPPAIM